MILHLYLRVFHTFLGDRIRIGDRDRKEFPDPYLITLVY